MLGIRFVSHGPHDDAGMIFVSRDQIPQDLLVMLSSVDVELKKIPKKAFEDMNIAPKDILPIINLLEE